MSATEQAQSPSILSRMGKSASSEHKDEPIPPTVYMTVLTAQQYKVLEQKVLQGNSVREETSSIQAGYQLGIEHVLRVLRNGFVSA